MQSAAKELKLGELVAFPTETVYGLGAVATNEPAVKRVYLAKGRPSDNPLIVTVANPAMVARFAEITPAAQKIMDAFWPGPVTIILPIKPNALPTAVTGGLSTAAFRMPENRLTRKLIELVGDPIVGPSANSSGKPSPTTAQHVYHDLRGKIKGILDDGPTTIGVESTIIDLSVTPPAVLRPGAITPEQLEQVLGVPVTADHHHVSAKETPKAPGMKYKHYAPSAQVLIVQPDEWNQALAWAQTRSDVGLLHATFVNLTAAHRDHFGKKLVEVGADAAQLSAHLFAGLRYFDTLDEATEGTVKYILAPAVANTGIGAAYMNRLDKAAGHTYFATAEL